VLRENVWAAFKRGVGRPQRPGVWILKWQAILISKRQKKREPNSRIITLEANDRFSSNNRVTPSTVGDYWLSDSDIVYEPVVDNLSWLWRIIIFVPPISSLSIASLKRKPSNNAISCLRGRAREIVGLSSRKDSFDSEAVTVTECRIVRPCRLKPQQIQFLIARLQFGHSVTSLRRRYKPAGGYISLFLVC